MGLAGRIDAAFIAVDPASGLIQTTTNAMTPTPVVTYAGIGSGFFLFFEGRSGGSASIAIAKFAVPTPPAGESITGAALNFEVPRWQPTIGTSLALRVEIFGTSSPTTTPSDFATAGAGSVIVPLSFPPTSPQTFSLDMSTLFRSLAQDNPAVAFRFSVPSNGNANVSNLQLVVSTGAVPEPASLMMVGMAGIVWAGGWPRRRARA